MQESRLRRLYAAPQTQRAPRISQIPTGIYSDMPRDARRDIFADAKAILRCCAVILYSPLTLAKRISLAVRRISLRSNITRRKANITEKALANASAFSWLPLLGSNQRHRDDQSRALPTELRRNMLTEHQQYYYSKHIRNCQCFFAFLQKYFCPCRRVLYHRKKT